MKKLLSTAIAASIFALSAQISAAPQWCTFTIDRVWTDASGGVLAFPKERGDHLLFCNLTQEHKGVKPQTCKSWNQLLTLATLTKKKVIIHYPDIAACESIPHYGTAPIPTYIMLDNP
jgi:hypothetical protein